MSGYKKRRQKTRPLRKVYVIVCEGKKTERMYFQKYRTRYSNLLIETPDSNYTDPKNLVNFAKRLIKEKNLIFDNGDAIWCVFDCDDNKNIDLADACRIAGKNIKISFSNPCFELWYLLHYEFIATKFEHSKVIQKLKEHMPTYEKNKDVYDLLFDKRFNAIENAKKLSKLHEKNGMDLISVESNPSTQVYRLVEEILEITQE